MTKAKKILDSRSMGMLDGVHPDLKKVMVEAFARHPITFRITQGKRSRAEQARLVKLGKSKTMNSRHLTGHAVDVVMTPGGKVSWEWTLYEDLAKTVLGVAAEMKIPMRWGGDWNMNGIPVPRDPKESFADGPHFELLRSAYPS